MLYILCFLTVLYHVINRAYIQHWLTLWAYGKHTHQILKLNVFTLMTARYIVMVNTVYFSGCWTHDDENKYKQSATFVGGSYGSYCRDDCVIVVYKQVRSNPCIFYEHKHCITSKHVFLKCNCNSISREMLDCTVVLAHYLLHIDVRSNCIETRLAYFTAFIQRLCPAYLATNIFHCIYRSIPSVTWYLKLYHHLYDNTSI